MPGTRSLIAEYTNFNVPPDFATHSNYVKCLNKVSKGLSCNCELSINNNIPESLILYKKLRLIKLTLNSLRGEYEIISKDSEYAQLCVSWVAVKSYYLLFNLVLIIEYLVSGDQNSFNLSHRILWKRFKERLDKSQIKFDKGYFNRNFNCFEVGNFKVRAGANIASVNFDLAERFKQCLKKLVDYKLEDFVKDEKIKNFRTKKNQQRKLTFLKENNINICEFFYYYRIKANYRDLEFLDYDIDPTSFCSYFLNYYELTMTFYRCFGRLINKLGAIRIRKEIIQELSLGN